jgi:type IV secretory pathway VirB10-like protein
MSDKATEAAAPRKADPETLVLRGTPARVVRFRRGAIIAIAALGSTALVGVTWMALKPATLGLMAAGEERDAPEAKTPADALDNAPKSYGDVPQLGPPLPGDLGRPILEHQRSIGSAVPAGGDDAAQRVAQAAEAERQRIAAERARGARRRECRPNRPWRWRRLVRAPPSIWRAIPTGSSARRTFSKAPAMMK